MSTSEENLEKKKVIVRKGPVAAKPATSDDNAFGDRDYFHRPDRPSTPHDLYLTYDINGKLRTHTVYHSDVDPRKIAVRPGKKKKAPEAGSTIPQATPPDEKMPTETP